MTTPSQSPAADAATKSNTYWLIERGSPCEWWVGNFRIPNEKGGEWTTDSYRAMRFSEKSAAVRHANELLEWGIHGPLSATEHIDVSSNPQQLPRWVEAELNDGDRICAALGLERTEGGRLPMYKLLAKLRELQSLRTRPDAQDAVAWYRDRRVFLEWDCSAKADTEGYLERQWVCSTIEHPCPQKPDGDGWVPVHTAPTDAAAKLPDARAGDLTYAELKDELAAADETTLSLRAELRAAAPSKGDEDGNN